MKHTIDHRKPRSRRRPAYVSCPVRVGEVIKSASGARKFSRGKTMVVWRKAKGGGFERVHVPLKKRKAVANWSPEQVQEELAIANGE